MHAFLQLTKPRISVLFAITGLAAFMVERSLLLQPGRMWLLVLAIFCTGGAANAFNQYFEREVDSRMARTAKKRPLPQGVITPRAALWFSILLSVVGVALLWRFGGWLSAAIGFGTILFYSFYYTLWLKPRTPYNIVIGGIAGSTGPLIAWSAATQQLAWAPLLMFAIIFFWTPPHFWALALCCKADYERVGYPMLPLVVGDDATRRQILGYSFTLCPISLILLWLTDLGWFYGIAAGVLGGIFVWASWRVYREKTTKACWQLFGYSILYVLLLFVTMMIDVLIR